MTTTSDVDASAPVAVTSLVIYGVLAVLSAVAVNALVRVAATTLFGVPAEFGPLGWGPVVNTTVVGVVGAAAVYGFLARVSPRPDRYFLGVAIVVLVLSFGPLVVPPAFLAGAPVSVLLTLAVMHVTTAVVTVGLLPHAGKREVPSR